MTTKSKVPQIRFKGFSEEWELDTVGTFYNFKNGLNKGKEFFGYGTPIVNFTDVFHNRSIISNNLKGKVSLSSDEISNYNVKEGDIFFTRTSETINEIGYPSVMTDSPVNTVFSGFVLRARAIDLDPLALSFKQYVFFTDIFRSEMVKKSSMTTRALTSGTAIKQMLFTFPKDKNEQTKIGNYFQKLDKLIEQKDKKYQKLKQFKKAMLDKMFPKNGADTPEIRFKGFSGKWESKELGTIMDVTSVKRIHQSDWTNSGIRFLRARDIVADYKKEDILDYLYISEEKYNQYSLISGKVKQNDLLVTGVGTIGIPMLIKNDKPIYFKDGNIIWFKNENYLDGYFFYYSFINKTIQNYIKLSAGTGTVGTYTIESGKKTPIKIPKKAEQTKIGDYFQKLDKQIELQQKELEKLKNIKKASLSKMFV
ncbi:EcoKI restriction-modification system protein HsdS [Aliarcobacter thereius]|nr:EcoKI restriction-modification system protein HsdS [Aliarcobacter thereius]